ncbi:carboxymuconolactone decarboxylase family protein [Demequina aurantiaca]|uniref:carboxymuconolactone decarboxylase family protein n=1 Tax=Demequina aurantiaca TaxID=676200 RepID=UPI003D351556
MSEATMRPQFMKAMEDLDARIGKGVEPRIREMVRLRCSHINGCAYCIRLHSEQLASLGGSVHLISALARPVKLMREDLVSPAEAAALRFAEVLTDYPRGLEIEARNEAGKHFDADALGSLVEIIAVVNAWNRITRGSE